MRRRRKDAKKFWLGVSTSLTEKAQMERNIPQFALLKLSLFYKGLETLTRASNKITRTYDPGGFWNGLFLL